MSKSDFLSNRQQLKELRESLNLTQEALSLALGKSRQYIGHLESGIKPINDKFRRSVERYLEQKASKAAPSLSGLPYSVVRSAKLWADSAGMPPEEFISMCVIRYGQLLHDSLKAERQGGESLSVQAARFAGKPQEPGTEKPKG